MAEHPEATIPQRFFFLRLPRWIRFTLLLVALGLSFFFRPTTGLSGPTTQGHWFSILPPVLAVFLSVAFHRIVFAMLSALALGAFLAYGPSPWTAMETGFRILVWQNLKNEFNLYVLAFTFSLMGMVHVMSRSGGIQGLMELILKVARGPRSMRLSTAFMGLAIFFDDYASSVLVGATAQPLTDRWRISRAKLAYLIDSTSAPVAGVALVSTWIAFEAGLLNEIAGTLRLGMNGYEIFIEALPFRFYCLTTLFFVFAGAVLNRDFGPMYDAETKALREEAAAGGEARMTTPGNFQAAPGAPKRWINAVLPIAAVIAGFAVGALYLGRHAVRDAGLGFSPWDGPVWRTAFEELARSGAGSSQILFFSAIGGNVIAIFLASVQRILTVREGLFTWARASRSIGPALTILILAWAMKTVCTDALHTDRYLISVLGPYLPLTALPLATFVLAAGISFATGTSWGTMGILLPVALPLAHSIGAWDGGPSVLIFWLTAAAVLDGAIFGDHCSPISDTTVLSSIASGCDHLEHVLTQAPYAIACMVLAGSAGYLGVALGLPLGWCYLLIALAVVGLLRIAAKPLPALLPRSSPPPPNS